MPSKRTRTARKPVSEFSDELIAWIQGRGPHVVEGYFLSEEQHSRLVRQHGIEGVRPRSPMDRRVE